MHSPTEAGSNGPAGLEEWFGRVIDRVRDRCALEPVRLDPALAEPRSVLRIVKARHWNWTAPGFRKVFGMRFTVRVPSLDQMNFIMYPAGDRETPIFLFFCLLTGRKLIAHVNVNCPRRDAAYDAQWVEPLVAARARHGEFACADRYPEWMLRWRTPAGIYGMFPRDRFEDFMRCGLDYLDLYLDRAQRSPPVSDPAALEEIRAAHAQFVDDIRTRDKAQGMIARMIGAGTARRIFYEVTT
jgi:hypothetical protein